MTMLLPLLRTRGAQATWIVLWAAIAAALLVARFASADAPTPAPAAEAAPVAASIRLIRMTVAETTVEVSVIGREEFARLAQGPFAKLFDSAGAEHFVRSGHLDGRTTTVTFDGSAMVALGLARVEFTRAGLTNDPPEVAPGNERVTHVALEPLMVNLVPTGGSREQTNLGASATDAAGYGVTVTSVVRDDEDIVVTGHLDGFTREEIQSLDLSGTHLVLADGAERPFAGGSLGNGSGLSNFVFHFNLPRSQALARFEIQAAARVPLIVRAEASPEVLARLDALEARGSFVVGVALSP